jgi:hypothetical protein
MCHSGQTRGRSLTAIAGATAWDGKTTVMNDPAGYRPAECEPHSVEKEKNCDVNDRDQESL